MKICMVGQGAFANKHLDALERIEARVAGTAQALRRAGPACLCRQRTLSGQSRLELGRLLPDGLALEGELGAGRLDLLIEHIDLRPVTGLEAERHLDRFPVVDAQGLACAPSAVFRPAELALPGSLQGPDLLLQHRNLGFGLDELLAHRGQQPVDVPSGPAGARLQGR